MNCETAEVHHSSCRDELRASQTLHINWLARSGDLASQYGPFDRAFTVICRVQRVNDIIESEKKLNTKPTHGVLYQDVMEAFLKRSNHRRPEVETENEATPEGPPVKRIRVDSQLDEADQSDDSSAAEPQRWKATDEDGEAQRNGRRPTGVENALPPAEFEEDAIQEYETFKLSQNSDHQNDATGKERPAWVRGQSSIYVDAFNLALDTVLAEESSLFDEKELDVFRQWKGLPYESQFLYVFLPFALDLPLMTV